MPDLVTGRPQIMPSSPEACRAWSEWSTSTRALSCLERGTQSLELDAGGGASVGLSAIKKAGLTMEAARKNCELYRATTAAQQDTLYALPSLEKEALRNRLVLIERASKSLDALIEKTSKMVEAQNATQLMLFSLQTTRIKLDADRADTQLKISGLYTPPLSDKPLKDLVAKKQTSEIAEQRAQDKLNRQNNWDVALSVGVHQQVNPVAQGAQPYGAVSVNYNLASRAIDRHLDRTAQAYTEWKKVQEGDVVRNLEVLRQQLVESVAVQEAKRQSLQVESKQGSGTRVTVCLPRVASNAHQC